MNHDTKEDLASSSKVAVLTENNETSCSPYKDYHCYCIQMLVTEPSCSVRWLFTHNSTAVYGQVLIYTAESTGAPWIAINIFQTSLRSVPVT